MTAKSLLIGGALALASLSIASAKSYDITLTEPTQIGSHQLKPGDYSLKLKGNTAIFTNTDTSERITASVKIQNDAKKHDQTTVDARQQSGNEKVESIRLGGTTTTLEFGD